jgi:Fur family ferric uptake transcriptional regulator
MDRQAPDLSRLRPAGSKRSSKRDRILAVFLKQEAHLSADDLFDLVRREAPGIGRATVYRTLQWMVDAGLARKVDFGEGRSRFEPSQGHPRHFHLICNTCHRSSEFLSSDIESLVEEIATARGFAPAQTILQIYGVCAECQTGRDKPDTTTIDGATTETVFARDALRIAIATERSGLQFYTRAANLTKDARGRVVFERLANEEREHLATLQ